MYEISFVELGYRTSLNFDPWNDTDSWRTLSFPKYNRDHATYERRGPKTVS